jgi:hypothetical protein
MLKIQLNDTVILDSVKHNNGLVEITICTDFTTPLFYILAPTCFDSDIPPIRCWSSHTRQQGTMLRKHLI